MLVTSKIDEIYSHITKPTYLASTTINIQIFFLKQEEQM